MVNPHACLCRDWICLACSWLWKSGSQFKYMYFISSNSFSHHRLTLHTHTHTQRETDTPFLTNTSHPHSKRDRQTDRHTCTKKTQTHTSFLNSPPTDRQTYTHKRRHAYILQPTLLCHAVGHRMDGWRLQQLNTI